MVILLLVLEELVQEKEDVRAKELFSQVAVQVTAQVTELPAGPFVHEVTPQFVSAHSQSLVSSHIGSEVVSKQVSKHAQVSKQVDVPSP